MKPDFFKSLSLLIIFFISFFITDLSAVSIKAAISSDTLNNPLAPVVISSITAGGGYSIDGFIPAGALGRSIPLTCTVVTPSQIPPAKFLNNAVPLDAFQFTPEGLQFDLPITLNFHFPNSNPSDDLVDGTTVPVARLKVYWYDGFTWRLIAGQLDTVNNQVTIQTQHFSTYGLFDSAPLDNQPASSRPKERIITPNGDGVNDFAVFDNLNGATTIKIMDLNGRLVRTLQNVNLWNGKDDDGNIVANGVYVYQFRKNFETVTGTIGVAR